MGANYRDESPKEADRGDEGERKTKERHGVRALALQQDAEKEKVDRDTGEKPG